MDDSCSDPDKSRYSSSIERNVSLAPEPLSVKSFLTVENSDENGRRSSSSVLSTNVAYSRYNVAILMQAILSRTESAFVESGFSS